MAPLIVQMAPLNLLAAYPEILLLLLASIVLLIEAFSPGRNGHHVHVAALVSLSAVGALVIAFLVGGVKAHAFSHFFVVDGMANLLKLSACVALMITFVCARRYAFEIGKMQGEWYVFGLFSLLGQFILISANHLLVVYLGLEMMSLALYAAVALRRDHAVSAEAAMKYFILGALASGFLLYGISMLYGATGTLHLSLIPQVIATGQVNATVLSFSVVFLVAGLAFKLGAVPFHMWVPDVYQGAPTAITLMVSTGPKLAAFAMMMRVLVQGLPALAPIWQPMLGILAVASLAIGNLTAIVQTSLKRMLAYSAIGQVGFVLLGMVSGMVEGNLTNATSAYSAALFYMLVYVATTLGTFGLIAILSGRGLDLDRIDDLRGLSQRHPLIALLMMVFMFSLAGVPPTVGFQAKFAVLAALLDAGHVILALTGVLFSLIAAYYYLRIIKAMYFDGPETPSTGTTQIAGLVTTETLRPVVLMTVLSLAVLGLGVLPDTLFSVTDAAILQLLQ